MKISRLALSLALFVLTIPLASAAPNCTVGGVNGTFGFLMNAVAGDGSRGVGLGLITFDGNGNNNGGNLFIVQGPSGWSQNLIGFTGTYTVSPDCTGTVTTIDNTGGRPSNFNDAIDNSENGSQFTRVDPGQVQYGTLVAQGDISGWAGSKHTYAANLSGRIAGQGPVAYVGQIIMRANGTVAGTMTVTSTTAVNSGAISGTYTENADGTGTAAISLPGIGAASFSFILVNSGKQIMMVQTDANTVVSGTLLHLGAVS